MIAQKILLRGSICAAMLVGLSLNANAVIELADNGGFETGDLTGWTPFPGAGSVSVSTTNPASGTYSGNLDTGLGTGAGIDVLLKQANKGIGQVSPGDIVTISFDMRGTMTGAGPVGFAEFFSELSGGGTSATEILFGGGPIFPNANPAVWTNFSTTAVAGPDVSGGVTLQLKAGIGATAGTQANLFFDNVSMTIPGTAIPEPTSVALLGLGGLALVGLRRRR